jgi:hypothetical protein
MKTLEAIIEDNQANVIGAQTSQGVVTVAEPFPRSELAARARDLAAEFGITIPAPLQAVLPPE